MRHDAEQAGFADIRVQRKDRIGLENHVRLGTRASKGRVDHLTIAHLARQQAQRQTPGLFPRHSGLQLRVAGGQQNVALVEQVQRFEAVNGLFVQVGEAKIQFEPVQLCSDFCSAQR